MGAAGMCAIVYAQTKSGICVWILKWTENISILILSFLLSIGGINIYATYALLYFLTIFYESKNKANS